MKNTKEETEREKKRKEDEREEYPFLLFSIFPSFFLFSFLVGSFRLKSGAFGSEHRAFSLITVFRLIRKTRGTLDLPMNKKREKRVCRTTRFAWRRTVRREESSEFLKIIPQELVYRKIVLVLTLNRAARTFESSKR